MTDCDKFIYPILDWEDNAGLAVGMVFGGCLFIPLFHFVWIGLSKIREKIYYWTQGSSDAPVNGGRRRDRLMQTTEI